MIPLTKPYLSKTEEQNALKAIRSRHLSADGPFSRKLVDALKSYLKVKYVFLTPSASSGLELALRALQLPVGSEVILPSFTMTSTANAVLACNLVPKFADIEENDLALNLFSVEKNITHKTKAIITVHYDGRIGEIESLAQLARKHKLYLIEDAAAALGSFKTKKAAGTFGDMGVFSFHETKNVICGEGGALVTNNSRLAGIIDIIRDHGTNRSQVLKGVASSYHWEGFGGSFLLSDVLAAIALAQFKKIAVINKKRKEIFQRYYQGLEGIRGAKLPGKNSSTNWHTFYILVPPGSRGEILQKLRKNGIGAAFHYLPLHSSPMGKKLGNKKGDCPVSEKISSSLVRLPIYPDLKLKEQKKIILTVKNLLEG